MAVTLARRGEGCAKGAGSISVLRVSGGAGEGLVFFVRAALGRHTRASGWCSRSPSTVCPNSLSPLFFIFNLDHKHFHLKYK